MVVPNICGSSVWYLFHVILLKTNIVRVLLDFPKICAVPLKRLYCNESGIHCINQYDNHPFSGMIEFYLDMISTQSWLEFQDLLDFH